jgi:glucose-6-phosphate isomerase
MNFENIDEIVTLDCFSISKSSNDLEVFENPRLKKWMKHKKFIIFGTGGSSLGGQCIHAAFPNENVKFVSNLDPKTLEKVFSEINPQETGFLCISKSGETLETIYQTLLALNFAKDKEDKFVFITENKPSSLRELANQFNFLCLDHPQNIGGRFSVFSIVGMLPAVLCGINPREIRSGGQKILEKNLSDVLDGATFICKNFFDKMTQHVSFIYSDKLEMFGKWLAQLYAESTGKNGAGITPLMAMGSLDQHSQLQLYLDGEKDKIFTFLYENQNSNLFISENIPSRRIEIPQITPEILGELFMYFMLEVVFVCKTIGVNPFDQSAVEYGKTVTKKFLSNQKHADKI